MDRKPPLNYTPPLYNYPPPQGTPANAQFRRYNTPPMRSPRYQVQPGLRFDYYANQFPAPSPQMDAGRQAGPSRREQLHWQQYWQLYRPANANAYQYASYNAECPAGPSRPDAYEPIPLPSDIKKRKEKESSRAVEEPIDPNYYQKLQESASGMILSTDQSEDLKKFQLLLCQPFLNNTEVYIRLPKSLFPKAKSLNLDPNPVIDAFCMATGNTVTYDWILDMEFGVNHSRKRQIAAKYNYHYAMPIFDVRRHSIQCYNAPDQVYPGYAKCNARLKRNIINYYDSIISYWYKGYVITAQDNSLENFQAWLNTGMLTYGMCWP